MYKAIAVFDEDKVKGTITFLQEYRKKGSSVYFNLYNLPPNEIRAIHIHTYGDTTDGCMSLGGHWNPLGREHGSIYININDSHAGDLINNLRANENGIFKFSYFDPRINIGGDILYSIIGRSVVIHEKFDDLGLGNNKESKITGNAGGRMACAIIGHAKNS